MTSDRAAARKAEAVRLCGGTGHWVQHRDRQDECPLIERALSEAEDAALELAALAIRAACSQCEDGTVVERYADHACGGDEKLCAQGCPVEREDVTECEYCGRPMSAVRALKAQR